MPSVTPIRRMMLIGYAMMTGVPGQAWAAPAGKDWGDYLGGSDRNHASLLTQISRSNVGRLQRAWEYHTGDPGIMETNPIIVDGTLYGVTAANAVFALDAATGRELWRAIPPGGKLNRVVRGLTYWADGEQSRLFYTAGRWLIALAAKTGDPIQSFGDAGKADLKAGLGPSAEKRSVYSTSPGTVVGDLIVMPISTSEGPDAAAGSIQAFDVRSGRLAWVFRTIPAPGEAGHESWSPEAFQNSTVGGANCWAGMAVDRQRDILYVPTGSAAPDFWGGDRMGENRYANSLLALKGSTGRLLWHYQMVHHDLWDRDLPAPPNLLTVVREGHRIDAVAQITKQGFTFLFDRVTGEPLFPIREIEVPRSEVPGERSWPTQPVPELPAAFARQTFVEDEVNPWAPNREALKAKVRASRTGFFRPFGKYDTMLFPGFNGGGEWGGAAVDSSGVMYVNANEWVWVAKLKDAPRPDELARLTPGQRLYAAYCAGCHGAERAGNPLSGYPPLLHLGSRLRAEDVDRLLLGGRGRMPGFEILTAAQRRLVTDLVLDAEPPVTLAATQPDADPGPTVPYILDGYVKFMDCDGYPANRPPWGTLTAIDLNTGRTRWQVVLGEFKELTARGISPTGTENYGGPVVTASGLLFIAATMDNQLRAFDTETGRILWQAPLPAGGHATPSTYEAAGKQYVVIACGGGRMPSAAGDSYVAFSLP